MLENKTECGSKSYIYLRINSTIKFRTFIHWAIYVSISAGLCWLTLTSCNQ